ncbi:MAG: hypothetical protein L3J16_07995, partial [Anaerolineales bacterium]|nr:hypothetical protein [Anaerolineales bacterium]
PLPDGVDGALLKKRLYDEYRVEIQYAKWGGRDFLRLSVQGYNAQEDIDVFVRALTVLLNQG